MADQEKNVEDTGAEKTSGPETLTIEQVEELVKSRVAEVNKTWQSRFDTLRNEKTEAEKRVEETEKSWQEKLQSEVSGVRKELESYKTEARMATLRSQAIKEVSGAGLELDDVEEKLVYRLIDPSADEPLADVKAYVEREQKKRESIKLSAADEFAKKNGRRVTETDKNSGVGSFDQYTPEQVKRMSNEEFERVFANSRK